MCTAVGFDSSFDCERFFSHVFIAENCQKIGLQHFSTLPKSFYPVAQTIKVNWAS